MRKLNRRQVSGSLIARAFVFLITYSIIIRPRLLNWGASQDEVGRKLSGDELLPSPMLVATRAITIRASATDIWPWLVQMGYDRAGWYTPQGADTFWDYVIRRRFRHTDWYTEESLHSLDTHQIIPEFQQLAVGDRVAEGPDGYFTVMTLEPDRALVYHSTRHPFTGHPVDLNDPQPGPYIDFSWAFVLDPIDDNTTRLINRVRLNHRWGWLGTLILFAFFEPADTVMELVMLRGIKQRVEMATQQHGQIIA